MDRTKKHYTIIQSKEALCVELSQGSVIQISLIF